MFWETCYPVKRVSEILRFLFLRAGVFRISLFVKSYLPHEDGVKFLNQGSSRQAFAEILSELFFVSIFFSRFLISGFIFCSKFISPFEMFSIVVF